LSITTEKPKIRNCN